jgi:hypothetical protein
MFPYLKTFRHIVLAIVLFQATSCHSQSASDPQLFHSTEFNWTITIPKGFQKVPDTTWARLQNKGTTAIENTYDVKVENQAKTLFVFRSDQFHYFESNYQPFDPARDGPYEQLYDSVNSMLYGTFKAQMPNATLDSSTRRETVSGKEFHVFLLDIHITPQVTLHILMYCRLFGKKEFTVNIMYVDPAKGKALLDAWKGSTFN